MSLESEMVDDGSLMEAGLTDKDMILELEMVDEGSVIDAGLTYEGM